MVDEEFLRFLDQTKQAAMQWVQDPNQSNVDNVNIGMCTFQQQKEGTCES